MPTSDTKIQDAFRRVYGRMIDDCPPAPEWEDISTPTLSAARAKQRRAGWLVAAGTAILMSVAVGGVVWLVGPRDGGVGVGPGTESPTTTLPAAVARMTVVFRPGELSEPEWDAFITVVGHYPSATGYFFADQATAREQAASLFADDVNALRVLGEYPDIATGYAQVDFAMADDAFAFQEQVTSLSFVVTAIGPNGPRLGRGYDTSPELSLGDDGVRAEFWQYAYRLDLPPEIQVQEAETTVTTTAISTTEILTPSPYPTDDLGRRLVLAEAGLPVYACGWIVFPEGDAPDPVATPTVAVEALLDGAGPAGVDQENFYDIYDWTMVFESPTWVSLLGYPNTPSRPDFYPASYGYVEFGRYEERWIDVSSAWCDPVASSLAVPQGTASITELWPETVRLALTRRAAGLRLDEDTSVLISGEMIGPGSAAAEWRLDPSVEVDPESRQLRIEIQETACAGGRPPDDRDITVLTSDRAGALVLTVFVAPVEGGARCPGNPWYPITVELDRRVGDQPVIDGRSPRGNRP